jgi:hypothetical protein
MPEPPLATPEAVGRLFGGITGRAATVKKPAAPLDLNALAPKVYGVYRDAETEDVGLCVMDYPLAAYAGGAMVLFPKSVIDEAIKAGSFSEGLQDTVQEILNVCAQMFAASHMILDSCFLKRAELPQKAVALIKSPAARLDVEVAIAGFGSGRIAFLVSK